MYWVREPFILLCWISLWLSLDLKAAESKGGMNLPRGDDRKVIKLTADATWQVEVPNPKSFGASGLLMHEKKLLLINDRSPELFWIELGENGEARLERTGWFTPQQLAEAKPGVRKWDCEGIAGDPEGNLYVCEESSRTIFKLTAAEAAVKTLNIDFSAASKYFSGDRNASFEGITIGGGKLWIANERNRPRVLAVDLSTLALEETFYVDASTFAFGGPHYSDLSWFDGRLYVLDRNHRAILEVDPTTRKVVTEYSFAEMELAPDVAYQTDYPTGTMEGLAMDREYFWLVTDNNGKARINARNDIRPTLFRCKRPQAD